MGVEGKDRVILEGDVEGAGALFTQPVVCGYTGKLNERRLKHPYGFLFASAYTSLFLSNRGNLLIFTLPDLS